MFLINTSTTSAKYIEELGIMEDFLEFRRFLSVDKVQPSLLDKSMMYVILLVIRFMADLLRKYRGSVVIMVGRGGAEPNYVHN